MSMPLEGIRIIEWGIWQQAPAATSMLGDLGAEVIKIEDRVEGDPLRGVVRMFGVDTGGLGGKSAYFEFINRSKKSITLDIKKPKGREIIQTLVRNSDVFIQNFRKGVTVRNGLDYESLSKYNPKLVYVNATGFGSKGPDREVPSMDLLGQARSGMMTTVGEPGMPPLNIVGAVADQVGAIMIAYGIVTALLARERLGIGQEIDISALGSNINIQQTSLSIVLLLGQELNKQARARALNPIYNWYMCRDGKWLAFAHTQSDRFWPGFCKAIEMPQLENDPRFNDSLKRQENCQELISILDKVFASKTLKEWSAICKEHELIFSPINRLSDLAHDPQVVANELIVDFDHPSLGKIKMLGIPVKFSKTPGAIQREAPEFGQHTEEVLSEICGFSWEDISKLREQEVI